MPKTQKHFVPRKLSDKVAYFMVKLLGYPRIWFFGQQHARHILVLETVAAIPGMVAGALIHFSSLRRIADDKGWIESLIKEADTERKHLLTFREIVRPSRLDRIIVWLLHFVFLIIYWLMYIFAPRSCHRFVGYLEEDAVEGYELYIQYLKDNPKENCPVPPIAYTFWNLPKKAQLLDLMPIILEEEAHHRDVNHDFADSLEKKER